MAYGRSKQHRPIWPEHRRTSYDNKALFELDTRTKRLEDEEGYRKRVTPESLPLFLHKENGLAFVHSFSEECARVFTNEWVGLKGSEILCNSRGVPHMASFRGSKGTHRFVVKYETWGLDNEDTFPDTRLRLSHLRNVYNFNGLGVAPTPSSLGRIAQIRSYVENNIITRYSLPTACENDIKKNSYGGMIVTNGIGQCFSCLANIDLAHAYVAHYRRHPDGRTVYLSGISSLSELTHYATYFVACTVTIKKELPLGPFPYRNSRHRIVYPTLKGVYSNVWLWKETIEACLEAGCSVTPTGEGWAWTSWTEDNLPWAEWAWDMRRRAPNEQVRKTQKRVNLAAIGRHAMGREHFILVGENRRDKSTDACVINYGEPIDLFIHPTYDNSSANMVHWNAHTVNDTNLSLYYMALPYALEGRLMMCDTDGFFVLDGPLHHQYLQKKSIEALEAKPGDMTISTHHNVKILRNRIWTSDEEPYRYGKLLERMLV